MPNQTCKKKKKKHLFKISSKNFSAQMLEQTEKWKWIKVFWGHPTMENLNVASAANGTENRMVRRSEQNPSTDSSGSIQLWQHNFNIWSSVWSRVVWFGPKLKTTKTSSKWCVLSWSGSSYRNSTETTLANCLRRRVYLALSLNLTLTWPNLKLQLAPKHNQELSTNGALTTNKFIGST